MTVPIILFSDFQKSLNTGNTSALLKARARELIEGVTELVQSKDCCNRRFDRWYETRYFSPSVQGDISEDGYLMLDEDLNELTGLINNHSTAVAESDYVLFPQEASAAAKDMIRLRNNFYWQGSPDLGLYSAIQVTGFWGYGGSFTRRTVLTAGVDETGLTLSVAANDGLEMGQMLRMGDELMLIDQEVTGLTIHVERAINFSLAESHLTGDGLYVFRAHPTARRLVNRICKWQSALDDNPLIALVTVGDGQEPIDLSAAPKDVEDMIGALRRSDRISAI